FGIALVDHADAAAEAAVDDLPQHQPAQRAFARTPAHQRHRGRREHGSERVGTHSWTAGLGGPDDTTAFPRSSLDAGRGAGQPSAMTMMLVRNADVYAPAPLGRQDLLVGGGQVLWMGAEAPALPDILAATTVDLAGRRLVPGFIDGHVHVTGGGGEAGFASRVPAPMLSRYTRGGVTSVVGLLGTDDVARGTRELVAGINALREE